MKKIEAIIEPFKLGNVKTKLAGEKMVNVLQLNLELRKKYGSPS